MADDFPNEYKPHPAFADVVENWAAIGAGLREAAVAKMRAANAPKPTSLGSPPRFVGYRPVSWGVLFETGDCHAERMQDGRLTFTGDRRMVVGPQSGIDPNQVFDQLLHPAWGKVGHPPRGNC